MRLRGLVSTDYFNYVNQNVVNDMVDQGMMALTSKATVADAWRTLLPNYQTGQGIAIKLNFNNSGDPGYIDGLIQPVNAVVRGLKQIGVAETDVWVYDAIRRLPDHFVTGCQYGGVRFFGENRESPGWSSNDPHAYVAFYPSSGISMPPATRLTDLLIAGPLSDQHAHHEEAQRAGPFAHLQEPFWEHRQPGRIAQPCDVPRIGQIRRAR